MASVGPSFASGENVGLFLLAGTSGVSATAIIGLLSYIAYSAVCILPGSSRRWRIGSPTEVYFLNQLVWDLVLATGGLMNIKWGVDKAVEQGPYCSAQGALKQMSDVGSALSALIISLYTLRVVCFWRIGHKDEQTECTREITSVSEHRRSLIRSYVVVACLWCFLGLLVTVNVTVDGVQRFYGPTGYWCWIQAHYSVQRTATDFGVMWFTVLCNIVVYGILFLYFKGYITTDGWHIQLFREPAPSHALMPLKRVYGLLFYPIIYTATILPLSIARYSTFAHHQVPFHVTIIVDCIYLSNGLLNVILFSLTRPYLLPHDPRVHSIEVVLEQPRSETAVGVSYSGEVHEGASPSPSRYWFGNTQADSPTTCCFSENEMSVQGSGVPLDEKFWKEV